MTHDALATSIGVAPAQIRTLRDSIVSQIASDGVLVRVHVGRWRATHQLSPEDLGLSPEVAQSLLRQIRLGAKLLLPKAMLTELSRLETLARGNLDRHAADTTLGAFVRASRFASFRDTHNDLAARYLALRDDLINRLDDIREELRHTFTEAAEALYPQVRRHTDVAWGEFVSGYVNRALDLHPSRETIRDSFYMTYDLTYVPLGRQLLADEIQRAQAIRDPALRADLETHLRDRAERTVTEFLEHLARDYRQAVHQAATRLLERVTRAGTLRRTTARRLAEFVEQLRDRDPYGDLELRPLLDQLDATLSGRIVPRPQAVADLLTAIVTVTHPATTGTLQLDPLLARFHNLSLLPDPTSAEAAS